MKFLKQQDGFTLVELLVSMALLSLMAIYTVQALSMLHNMNRVEADVAARMEVDAVLRHLRSELSDIRAVFLQSDSANGKLAFEGGPGSLTYVAASNGEREVGGLYLVKLSLDGDGTLKSSRRLFSKTPSERVNEVILLRGVKAINFTYRKPNQAEPQNQWGIENQLPLAIGVKIQFGENDKRHEAQVLIKVETAE